MRIQASILIKCAPNAIFHSSSAPRFLCFGGIPFPARDQNPTHPGFSLDFPIQVKEKRGNKFPRRFNRSISTHAFPIFIKTTHLELWKYVIHDYEMIIMKRSRSDVKLTLRMSRGLRPMSHPGHPAWVKAHIALCLELMKPFNFCWRFDFVRKEILEDGGVYKDSNEIEVHFKKGEVVYSRTNMRERKTWGTL